MKYLSGIQPSGQLHLGNYFGAIKQHLAAQGAESAYFIADYHALTSLQDASQLQSLTLEVAATYYSLGLDPDKCLFYKQSDVPQVTELAWILSTVTGMGLLQRGHAYKDKTKNGLPASLGLFSYPVLMAADILMFDTELVPVGGDQVQHVEMAADIAGSFNAAFGKEVFRKPLSQVSPAPKVLGLDGQKMSKSYKNTIPLFSDDYFKYCSKIKTDKQDFRTQPLTVEGDITFHLFEHLFKSSGEREFIINAYLNDRSFGYGHAKKLLSERLEETFGPARDRFKKLMNHPEDIRDRLAIGAKKASTIAAAKIEEVRCAVGI